MYPDKTTTKIVQYVSIMPNAGGVADVLTTIAEEAVAHGFDMRVLVGKPIKNSSQYIKRLRAHKIPIEAVNENCVRMVSYGLNFFIYICGALILLPFMICKRRTSLSQAWAKIIRELRYELQHKPVSFWIDWRTRKSLQKLFANKTGILHVHFLGWKECYAVLEWGKKHGLRTLIHYHNEVSFGQVAAFKKLFNSQDCVVPRNSTIIVLSETIRERMKHLAGNGYDIEVIPNWVNDECEEKDETKRGVSPVTFCSVGRMVGGKGFEDVIRAVALVAEGIQTNVRCIIVGGGPGLPYMEDLASRAGVWDMVVFKGELTEEKVLRCLKESDVFVMPSSTEGLPVILLKAMALSKPIIATGVGGIGTMIREANNGLLVDVGNIRELCAAMKALALDPGMRREMSINSRKKFLSCYSKEVVWPQLQKIYLKNSL
jgi:glycosyltransferase involved in cell wall biosynthesis